METSTEIWKPVQGYEGLYEVSNLGRVRSIDHTFKNRFGTISLRHGKILTPRKYSAGYFAVHLCDGKGGEESRQIHRIVAEAFIPVPHELEHLKGERYNGRRPKLEVNHKNEIKADNRVENLEWCDAKYNSNYGTHPQRLGIQFRKRIVQLTDSGEVVAHWESITAAAKATGIRRCAIGGVLNHYRYTKNGHTYINIHAGGYRWEWE